MHKPLTGLTAALSLFTFQLVFGPGLSAARAVPNIQSATGALVSEQNFIITGAGFGPKSPVRPWLFDDFEGAGANSGGQISGRLSPVGNREWRVYASLGLSYDAQFPYSGSFSAYGLDDPAASDFIDIFVSGQAARARYVSYRFRRAGGDYGAWKIDRTTSGTTNNPPYDSAPNFGWGEYTYHNDCAQFFNDGWLKAFPAKDVWHRLEYYYAMSDKGVANGTMQQWMNQTIFYNKVKNVMTCSNSCGTCQIDTWMTPLIANNTEQIQIWVDDIYIDDTLSRVELCTGTSWDSRGDCELQIPSAWSAGSITATAKLGKFLPGAQLYLYVVDSEGSSNSSGFPVQLGAGTRTPNPVDTLAPAAPGNLRGQS